VLTRSAPTPEIRIPPTILSYSAGFYGKRCAPVASGAQRVQ